MAVLNWGGQGLHLKARVVVSKKGGGKIQAITRDSREEQLLTV